MKASSRFQHNSDFIALLLTALERTFVHKVNHSFGLECATRKVETCGPASIVVELEQAL